MKRFFTCISFVFLCCALTACGSTSFYDAPDVLCQLGNEKIAFEHHQQCGVTSVSNKENDGLATYIQIGYYLSINSNRRNKTHTI